MEMEYRDPSRRGRYIVIIGVILALVAGGAAFYLISQAQQQAGQAGLQRVAVVVAAPDDPGPQAHRGHRRRGPRGPARPDERAGHRVDPGQGHRPRPGGDRPGRPDGHDQPARLEHRGRPVLGPRPGRDGRPRQPEWRAISMTVPDDRAVGGLLTANQTVDVFVTASINVLSGPDGEIGEEGYYTDKSTKITYQNMLILAKAGQFYILKAPLDVAEEISHLQASGAATFSLALRPGRRHPPGRRVEPRARRPTRSSSGTGCRSRWCTRRSEGPLPTPAPTPDRDPGAAAERPRRSRRPVAVARRPLRLAGASISAPLTRRASRPPGLPRWPGRPLDSGPSDAGPRPARSRAVRPGCRRAPARVDDARRGGPQPGRQVALGGDRARAASSRRSPRPIEPLQLDVRIARDEPDLVAQRRQPALDELDRLDDDRRGARGVGRLDRGQDARPDRGMDDRLEVAQRGRDPRRRSGRAPPGRARRRRRAARSPNRA